MTIKQAIALGTEKLNSSSETPRLDAELLLAHLLEKPREWILTHPEFKLNNAQTLAFELHIVRRAQSKPVAYLIGKKEFYGLEFAVTSDTLIPRPETELLVEQVLKKLKSEQKSPKNQTEKEMIIDVGTGSGAIIISLAKQLKATGVDFLATDISRTALKVAQRNARAHAVENKIKFLSGNLLEPIINDQKLLVGDRPLLILANLPYLSEKIYSSAPKSVRDYEPKTALLSGTDGLDHYRQLFTQIQSLLAKHSAPITPWCEISPEQKNLLAEEARKIFPSANIKFHKDLSQRWRLAEIHI